MRWLGVSYGAYMAGGAGCARDTESRTALGLHLDTNAAQEVVGQYAARAHDDHIVVHLQRLIGVLHQHSVFADRTNFGFHQQTQSMVRHSLIDSEAITLLSPLEG